MAIGAHHYLVQQRLEIGHAVGTGLFDPHPIHIQVQNLKPQILGGFLDAQGGFASIGRHGLLRFDPPEAGVLVPQISEAGNLNPTRVIWCS
jgi:hypothetical protein